MKNVKLLLVSCFLLIAMVSCIKKKETTIKTTEKKAVVKQTKTKPTAFQTKIQKIQKERSAKRKEFDRLVSKPVMFSKKEGKFIVELATALKLKDDKIKQVSDLINKYQRQGKAFRFFGSFRIPSQKPFSRELTNILTPVQVEQFKHLHAYWYDLLPAVTHSFLPLALKYRLPLTKEQYYSVVEIYSDAVIAGKTTGNKIGAVYVFPEIDTITQNKILSLLNEEQQNNFKLIHSIYWG